MSNLRASSSEISNALAQCTGTEFWYRHPLARACLYTDGVRIFCTMAEAYWFLDIVATEVLPMQKHQPFIAVTLSVKGAQAVITAQDGNYNHFWKRDIEFTDCPEGDWKFYLIDNVLLVTSEY